MAQLPPLIGTNRGSLEVLAAYGEHRRTAYAAAAGARVNVRQVVLAAAGAQAPAAEIARIASEVYIAFGDIPRQVHTRQGVYKILDEQSGNIPEAYAAAGSPAPDAALAALAAEIATAVPVVAAYDEAREGLIDAMWACIEAGRGPAEVATASKFASATAYRYLGCRDRWARIQEALDHAGLLHGGTDDDLPLLGARHWGTAVLVNNFWDYDDVHHRLRAALATIGETVGARTGVWTPVKPDPLINISGSTS